jgi:CBS domain-containing protein
MLLRKRAWDIMREEFPSVQEDAAVQEVVKSLAASRTRFPDNNCVVVNSRKGEFRGVVSMWNLIHSMGPCLLKGMGLDEREVDWDKAFERACRECAQDSIAGYIQTDVPRIKANDPLARILEIFLDYRRGRAVVEEGGKVIGIVLLADLYREIACDL